MPDDLVTVATFTSLAESNIARNLLDEEGIPAFLADETTVAMAWHLTTAVGGVKLQVPNSQKEEAISALKAAQETDVGSNWQITDEGLPDPDLVGTGSNEAEEIEPAPSERDLNAGRAFRGAVIGLLFLPLQLYVFCLLISVFVSNEPMDPKSKRQAWFGAMINLPLIAIFCIFLRAYLMPESDD